jgi:hypothetical protein
LLFFWNIWVDLDAEFFCSIKHGDRQDQKMKPNRKHENKGIVGKVLDWIQHVTKKWMSKKKLPDNYAAKKNSFFWKNSLIFLRVLGFVFSLCQTLHQKDENIVSLSKVVLNLGKSFCGVCHVLKFSGTEIFSADVDKFEGDAANYLNNFALTLSDWFWKDLCSWFNETYWKRTNALKIKLPHSEEVLNLVLFWRVEEKEITKPQPSSKRNRRTLWKRTELRRPSSSRRIPFLPFHHTIGGRDQQQRKQSKVCTCLLTFDFWTLFGLALWAFPPAFPWASYGFLSSFTPHTHITRPTGPYSAGRQPLLQRWTSKKLLL